MELITGRLLLRRPVADDAADALLMLQDPEVVRWNPAPAVIDIETARAWSSPRRGLDRRNPRYLARCGALDRPAGSELHDFRD